MGYYIDQQGNYYEGDKADYRDQAVPQRPDSTYILNGGVWVENSTLKKDKLKEELMVLNKDVTICIDELFEILLNNNIINQNEMSDDIKIILSKRKIITDKIKKENLTKNKSEL